ncbi:MAG: hypothetical protein XU12_C0030G0001, partial [Deltaproteobacteria bacterium CSP1-8]
PLGYASDLAPARCRFRSTQVLPRSTGRLVDPPASPRVPRALVSSYPDAGGAAEGRGVRAELSGRKVKRRLAGSSRVERRSENPPPRMRKPAMAPCNGARSCGARRRRERNVPVPASRGPFRKRSCTERVDAPHPARRQTEAYPQRYGEGWQRSRCGCNGPRMPGSDGMCLWRPARGCWRPVPRGASVPPSSAGRGPRSTPP